jgi:SAM-dependent methyltransferase
VRPGELLLDIGSGYGRVLDYLEQKGFDHVFGLESDFRYLEKNPLSVVCGRGEQAPFKNESFGAIFSIGVLSYFL